MDKPLLFILLWVIKKINPTDVSFPHLEIIVRTKLLLDKRRPLAAGFKQKGKERKNPLTFSLIMYGILGIFFGGVILGAESFVLPLIVYHSYLLVMMSLLLITDFSSILLDTTDNIILGSKPITGRTLFLARVVHITIYLGQFFIVLSFFSLLAIFFKYGFITGFVAICTSLLIVLFSVFLTYILYGILISVFSEDKVKDIVGYFQIFITVLMMAGYQFMPRLMDFGADETFVPHIYTYFIPSAWMAFTLEAINTGSWDTMHIIMSVCAVVIPFFTLWIMMKFLAPLFARKLGSLGNVQGKRQTNNAQQSKIGLSQKISPVFCKSNAEQAAFEQTWKITGRDKNFKIQFYPGIGYFLVLGFITIFRGGQDIQSTVTELSSSGKYLWLIYLPIIIATSAIYLLPFHENYTAAWIYDTAPVPTPGKLLSGGLKAILVKFFLPFYFVMAATAISIWGPSVIDDCILGLFNDIFVFYLIATIADKYLPFSQKQSADQQSGKFARTLLQILIIGVIVGMHYFAAMIPWLVLALSPVSIAGIVYLQRRLAQTQWSAIKS